MPDAHPYQEYRPGLFSSQGFPPEHSPFRHIFVDVTYRCNMRCANCYVSTNGDREEPDADRLLNIIGRLPHRTNIRLLGGEPTLRHDLPDIIRRIRSLKHTPVLLTNGLKLVDISLVRNLKEAGLRTVHLSCNGGFRDDLYERIDQLRCAHDKMRALENLCREQFSISVGMILVAGVNVAHLHEFAQHLKDMRHVRELKLRSVGRYGRFLDTPPLTMKEMMDLCETSLAVTREAMVTGRQSTTLCSFSWEGKRVQLTKWPDLDNPNRGYLTPEGSIAPFFEYLVANGHV